MSSQKVLSSDNTNPVLKVGDQQAGRATMLRLQGLAFIGIDDPGLPSRHLVQGQIGGIAAIAEGEHVTGRSSDLRE